MLRKKSRLRICFMKLHSSNLKYYKYYVPHVYCSIVYNSQDMEAAQVCTHTHTHTHTHTLEYYPVIKKEILAFVKTWMYLEGVMPMNQRKSNTI